MGKLKDFGKEYMEFVRCTRNPDKLTFDQWIESMTADDCIDINCVHNVNRECTVNTCIREIRPNRNIYGI